MFKNMLVATAMTAFLCTNARADMCDGPITSVAVQSDGSLHIRHAGGGNWLICSVTSDGVYEGVTVTAAACRSWQAIFMAAHKAGTTVRLYTQGTTCSTLPSWSPAAVYFVEDLG
jgi:hypothetical protein